MSLHTLVFFFPCVAALSWGPMGAHLSCLLQKGLSLLESLLWTSICLECQMVSCIMYITRKCSEASWVRSSAISLKCSFSFTADCACRRKEKSVNRAVKPNKFECKWAWLDTAMWRSLFDCLLSFQGGFWLLECTCVGRDLNHSVF